jgi:citrate synthase
MGFGHRVYRAEDRAPRVLRRTRPRARVAAPGGRRGARARGARRAAARKPDRVLATNVEFWSAVVLDVARCRRSSSRPCSRARASRAGRRTSSSRSARAG